VDKYVISEKLTEQINRGEVQACVFTSYCFDPDFFEIDVIPNLLRTSISYSSDERVKKYQVAEALRVSGLDVEVFFDQPMFSPDTGPSMQYLFHGVNLLPNIFHAKNIYLLVNDSSSGTRGGSQQRLLVAAGSNNLTRSGWWENIETQHWEEVTQTGSDGTFVKQLLEDLEWLKDRRNLQAGDGAIEKLISFLRNCEMKELTAPPLYFGLRQKKYFEFIKKHLPTSVSSKWNLEIISPFFVNDSLSLLHEKFFEMGIQEITMLLPLDQDSKARCELQYYETIRNADRICWGQWNDVEAKGLGINEQLEQYRTLHAKVYHFFNDKESWVFVGSVNFTHKATSDNVETGFFINQPLVAPLLTPLPDEKDVECTTLDDNELFSHDAEQAIVDIYLSYDWKSKKLQGRTNSESLLEISIIKAGGEPVLDSWHINNEERTCEVEGSQLEGLLKQSGFVNVLIWQDARGQALDKSVLVLQTGWSHKPTELPDLSPEDILLIYAGMSENSRQMMLMNARIKSFLRENRGGELNSADSELNDEGFFCEYAGIFHAFRQFKSRLTTLFDNNIEQLDYYLSGTGADSLPALISKANEKSGNSVASYLIMLSIDEILSQRAYQSRLDVKKIQNNARDIINRLERLDGLILEEGTNRRQFFSWLKTEFVKSYVVNNISIESSENG